MRGTGNDSAELTPMRRESLPRARDGVVSHDEPSASLGITPACAGRGPPAGSTGRAAGNHSRVRGTGAIGMTPPTCTWESLPRARDGVARPGFPDHDRGITPACAGRGRRWFLLRGRGGNHSRVRGTGSVAGGRPRHREESLPRARDGGCVSHRNGPVFGITPACAGRGTPPRERQAESWNHSRVRGTGHAHGGRGTDDHESLPRARDGGVTVNGNNARKGITPACAGRG